MGYAWVDAVIKNPFSGRSISVKAIVNICTMLSVIPRRVADELQLPVIGRRRIVAAKGVTELVECIGVVEVMGRKTYTHIGIR